MGFIDSVSSCLGKYAVFSGRATRSEYWWMYLFTLLAQILAGAVAGAVAYAIGGMLAGIIGLYIGMLLCSAGLVVPSIAAAVRRLHDTGHSGWWYFINLVPLIGSIWFLILMLHPSEDLNEYGYPPY